MASHLDKLQKFWLNTDGGDYLKQLLELRADMGDKHPSIPAIELEIDLVIDVYAEFCEWLDNGHAEQEKDKFNNVVNKIKSKPENHSVNN